MRCPFARTASWLALASGALGFLGAQETALEEPAAAPTAAVRAEKLKLIRSVFKDDYAKAKQPGDKRALAKKLLDEGLATRDDPAARFVLLVEARDLALDGGDARLALRAIDEIASRYLDVYVLQMQVEALEKAASKAREASEVSDIARLCLNLEATASLVDNYAVAKAAGALGAKTAAKSKNKHLARWCEYRGNVAAELGKEYEKVKRAAPRLGESGERSRDPDAALAVGRWRALARGEWDEGLALLRAGSDPELKALAEKEAAARAEVSSADALRLADDWQAAAGKLDGIFEAGARARAATWREQGITLLQGLSRTAAEDKLAQELGRADLKPGLVAVLFEGRDLKRKQKVRIDRQLDFDWGRGKPDAALPADRFSIRWTGFLRAPVPGEHTLKVYADDGVRLWLDGELVLDQWSHGIKPDLRVTAYLTDEAHDLRIELYDEGGLSGLRVAWSRPGGVEQLVPPYAFFHDATTKAEAAR
jgi:hypothetical protein